jgi:crossover junction endodeoxyribonuclease RuvC
VSGLPLTMAAEIAAALEGRREGCQWRCRCPIHGGRSLLVRDGDKGRILVFCHGGCEARDVLAELHRSGLLGGSSENYKLPPIRRNDRPDEAARTARALAFWRETRPAAGTIGAAGAIAHLDSQGSLIEVCDFPVSHDGPKNRRAVNALLLASIVFKTRAEHAFVEFVGARPGEGAVGAFAFGRSRGTMVLAACGAACIFIAPAAWKHALGLSFTSKDAAPSEAIRRWSAHAALFACVKDDGRAEAGLIAVAGLMQVGGA